jgi:4-alpha-glucanotransferase
VVIGCQYLTYLVLPTLQDEIESFRVQLDLKEVDYDATMNAKISLAKKVYHLEKDQIFASAAFGKYFEENKVSVFSYTFKKKPF